MFKGLFFLLLLSIFPDVFAGALWPTSITVSNDAGCVGLDNTPYSTPESINLCCNNNELASFVTNPQSEDEKAKSKKCAASFSNLVPAADQNIETTFEQVNTTLVTNQELNQGNSADYSDTLDTDNGGAFGPSGSTGTSQGSTAGGNSGSGGFKGKVKGGAGSGGKFAGSGGSSGGGSGGGTGGGGPGAGGGSSLGGGGGSGKNSGDDTSDGKSAEEGNAYGAAGGGAGGEGGGAGAGGGGEGGKYSNDGINEVVFGEEGAAAAAAAAGMAGDEDGLGSANDPANYFGMIDPKANIFRIITARYQRKKSLQKVGLEIRNGHIPNSKEELDAVKH
jgi:hypothetical protein